jgi:hypothetical protein
MLQAHSNYLKKVVLQKILKSGPIAYGREQAFFLKINKCQLFHHITGAFEDIRILELLIGQLAPQLPILIMQNCLVLKKQKNTNKIENSPHLIVQKGAYGFLGRDCVTETMDPRGARLLELTRRGQLTLQAGHHALQEPAPVAEKGLGLLQLPAQISLAPLVHFDRVVQLGQYAPFCRC